MARIDLKDLHERRQSTRSFRQRDAAYKLFASQYNSEVDPKGESTDLDIAYRPNLVDDVTLAALNGQDDFKGMGINQVRRINDHFTAMFASLPRISAVPYNADPATVKAAEGLSLWVQDRLTESNMETLHPRQAFWLSNRGDAVWQATWENDTPLVRTWDPGWCYPLLSPLDLGAVDDMLICFEVHPDWVLQKYGITVQKDDEMAKVYQYWTAIDYHLQVNETYVEREYREHGLGFVPFRVVFGNPSGLWAQSDVREIPKLAGLFNEHLLLAMDAIRKQVDPAWYVTGNFSGGKIGIEPGAATPLPEGANVGEWPSSVSPDLIMNMASRIEGYINSMAAISPISMTGQAQGSIVTGAAVRHQVEAAEQRAEARRQMLEACYAKIAQMLCRITALKFPDQELVLRAKQTSSDEVKLKGKDLDSWNRFVAQYGGFIGLPLQDRVGLALQGLGRLWDEEYAVDQVVGLPGIMPGQTRRRLETYQTSQAISVATAQAEAQKAAQQVAGESGGAGSSPGGGPPGPGGGGGLPPTALPQFPQSFPQPTPAQMGQQFITLGQVQRALALVESRLEGPVFAIGELAVAGQSSQPVVMVTEDEDLPLVQPLMKSLRGDAYVGQPSRDTAKVAVA